MGRKIRRKGVAELPAVGDAAAEDVVVQDETAIEGRNIKKRKSKKKNSGRKSGFPSWGADLGWRNVTPASDSLSLLVGSEEGGFLSLEEIDGEDWQFPGLEVAEENPSLEADGTAGKALSSVTSSRKKRKKPHGEIATVNLGDGNFDAFHSDAGDSRSLTEQIRSSLKKKKKKKKLGKSSASDSPASVKFEETEVPLSEKASLKGKKPKLGSRARKLLRGKRNGGGDEGTAASLKERDDVVVKTTTTASADEEPMDMSAWAEMRLHSKLERAIAELKFKEPTPIQKHCIPAAAHKGKDVIGAAETGSGKTLAFGLPILQRLLQEQDKALNQKGFEDSEDDSEETKSERSLGPLRALIITPTRELALQICEHLRAAAKWTNIRVVPIVGGMATQKQQRLLKQMPEIVVGTPGRLWELMSGGESHLLDLNWLSFFVLDEADRMVEKGHFKELQSIIDMLPNSQNRGFGKDDENAVPMNTGTVDGVDPLPPKSMKRRQTLVFSATLALPADFKSNLKRRHQMPKVASKSVDSVAALSERAGVSHEAAIVDLTLASIVAEKLSESIVECRDEDKDQYLYYILKVHGGGRTIVFCTSIAALRRASAILRLLEIPVWPLHAQMQQKARLKAMDRFRGTQDCVLVATDVAARGLDVPGIRTVVHYQLPHSAQIYVHRSGRTARASTDGISIALVSPADRAKYLTLCQALSRPEGLQPFPVNMTYLPAIEKRVGLAIKVDKLMRKQSQSKATEAWLALNAEAMEIDMEVSDDEDGQLSSAAGNKNLLSKSGSSQVRGLQKELHEMLSQPVKPKAFSTRYITGAGMTPLVTKQLQDYMLAKSGPQGPSVKKGKLVIIGQEQIEPLEALRLSNATPRVKKKRY